MKFIIFLVWMFFSSFGLAKPFLSNSLELGDGANTDKKLVFRKAASSNPTFRWNSGVNYFQLGLDTTPLVTWDLANNLMLVGSAATPQKLLHVGPGTGDSTATELLLEGFQGGFGAGATFQSRLLTSGAYKEMARIIASSSSSWDSSSAATQDASLVFYTTENGTTASNMVLDGVGNLSISGIFPVKGVTDASNAASGIIGEFISSNPGAPVSVAASGSFVTITSISLPAGDWDVSGQGDLSPGTISAGIRLASAISLTNNAQDTGASGGYMNLPTTISTTFNTNLPTGTRRVNVSSTTTVYLVGQVNYTTAGTAAWSTNSFIRARRVR